MIHLINIPELFKHRMRPKLSLSAFCLGLKEQIWKDIWLNYGSEKAAVTCYTAIQFLLLYICFQVFQSGKVITYAIVMQRG